MNKTKELQKEIKESIYEEYKWHLESAYNLEDKKTMKLSNEALKEAIEQAYKKGRQDALKEELEDWKKAYMKKEVVLGTEIEEFINNKGKQLKKELKKENKDE